ncbi:hypothetical protein EB796_006021 [Bugula neritina]|uniref:Uncharacterized protein n=1 Tax=Bugula neritina TaxID=10212 RepID=A0A7J7KBS1_BUGNE|nr:hypothetical protein EB796_006021 [Bugula neritina]
MGNSGSAGSKHSIKSDVRNRINPLDWKSSNQQSFTENQTKKNQTTLKFNLQILPATTIMGRQTCSKCAACVSLVATLTSWKLMSDKELSSPGTYYTDNITRSATLPPNINKVNTSPEYLSGYSTNTLNPSKLQARILPAYRDSHHSKIADIRNRQRMQSTATIYRQRHDSQTSNYSHRYSGVNRVVTTHIPAHIDKKLVRSRSVGVTLTQS